MGVTGTNWVTKTKISTDIMKTLDDQTEDAQLKNESQDIEIENLKNKISEIGYGASYEESTETLIFN